MRERGRQGGIERGRQRGIERGRQRERETERDRERERKKERERKRERERERERERGNERMRERERKSGCLSICTPSCKRERKRKTFSLYCVYTQCAYTQYHLVICEGIPIPYPQDRDVDRDTFTNHMSLHKIGIWIGMPSQIIGLSTR